MSSLAAARADNFYYGPDYSAKHGSLNKFRGSHPLGDRAKQIHEGILVIRFEMPYKVFCNKCNEVIAKGVRFNAKKKSIGQYFSTKILEFSMKCCFCENTFVIHTDPKNAEYVPFSGLRRKIEEFEAEDIQTIEFRSAEERAKIEKDPMLKLETTYEDLTKAKRSHNQLEDLMEFQELRHSSDHQYDLNSKVRKRFREWKKEEIVRELEKKKKKNFAFPLVSEHPGDIEEASSIDFLTHPHRLGRKIRERVVENTSIFGQKKSQSRCRSSQPSLKFPISNTKSSATSSLNSCAPSVQSSRLIPSSVHPALSLVVSSSPSSQKKISISSTEVSSERRALLHGDIERLKNVKTNAIRAKLLAERDR